MSSLVNRRIDLKLTESNICEPGHSIGGGSSGCGKMLIPRWAVELGLITAFSSYFLSTQHWLLLGVGYLIIRSVCSDLGQRCIKTIPRDFKGICVLIKIQLKMKRGFKLNVPVHEHFLEMVKQVPEKECVVEVETGRSLNFRQFNEHANKYANFFKNRKCKKDDVIALFLENGIEFFATWLGLSKLGVVSAWINSNLKLETLAHSLKVSNCISIITSHALLPKIIDVVSKGLLDKNNISIFIVDGSEGEVSGEAELLSPHLKDTAEPPRVEGLNFQSVLCYIYTSGTTGNPKAAIIRHYRYYMMGVASGYAFGVTESDRIYITLPMYHSAGGILGIGNVVVRGSTAVIRTKFSASNFWKDCVRHNCTASQYIGEICRYLLAQKPIAEENAHRVRVMYGNGLRPEIWHEFARRFRLKRVGELYGSTEGNSNILNLDNHEGSCGFIPIYPCLKPIYPVRLVKVDPETDELIRNPRTGLCVSCKPGDTGEMVGLIRSDDPLLCFEGYVNGADTKKKVIRDVMQKGDQVFSSGDILYWDKLGYLYFKDRRGDTFRWKGENCATTEVEGVVQPLLCIIDATVYGVGVPRCEGKAGMIAVSLADGTDLEKFLTDLASRLSENLAAYAVPVFLRVCKHVDRTGTFKLKKNELQKAGFDPTKCEDDPVYYWNSAERSYLPLDSKMIADINSGVYTRL